MKLLWMFTLTSAFSVFSVLSVREKSWWETAVVYQIYPRSFKDSNGDGIGDLAGITEKLDYLKSTGVDAIWMSPIFLSPMFDFGYDITDFKKIQPEYGTMDDFENLVKKAKHLDIKVILDLVPNHSSNQSDWFIKSTNREDGYDEYYIWADGKKDLKNPQKLLPPNNWVSHFRKSAWEYSKKRGQFYLHQFVVGQPDLNFRNPKVVEEMKDIIRFWLDKGVDGYRVDTIPTLFEVDPANFGGQYPDEPRSGTVGLTPDDYKYLNHIYSKNQDETYDMVYQWRQILDEYEKRDGRPRVMLTEAYEDINRVMRYYGNSTHNGAHLPFNFDFLQDVKSDSSARDVKFIIDKWNTYMPTGRTANWVNGNHDNSRAASRRGIEKADTYNMIALLLPGVAITYQGEELAMTDGWVSWEETVDPQACNTDDPINYYKVSRDPARTPFHWDDSKNAGFSSGLKTWLPVADNYKTVNVKVQKASPKSHYKFYTDLTALRKTTAFKYGDLEIKAISDDVFAMTRTMAGQKAIVAVSNLSRDNVKVNLSVFRNLPQTLYVYTSSADEFLEKGTQVRTNEITLSPYVAIVFESQEDVK